MADKSMASGPTLRAAAASVLVAEHQVQPPAHDADDERTLDSGHEPGDVERQLQLARDIAGQPEQQPVDHDRDEAEREYVECAADGLDDRLEHRVDDADDQRDDKQRPCLSGVAVASDQDSGDNPGRYAQCRRGHDDPYDMFHDGISTVRKAGRAAWRQDPERPDSMR